MSDLGDEMRDRPGRAPWQMVVVAAVVVAALVVGAVVLATLGDGGGSSKPHIAAPTVAVGDIDLAVLSTSFDEDGARGPVGSDVLDAVGGVAGVSAAQGAMQRFVEVVPPDTQRDAEPPASERSAIAISWEDGAPLAFSAGGPPQQSGEVAINQSLAAQYQVGVGDELALRSGPSLNMANIPNVRVVGVFSPAGGDVDDINLVVMRAEDLGSVTGRSSFDRVDIVADDHTPIDELLDRVAAVLPSGAMAVPPSVVGFDEQLRAELEIQRAYHWALNPDLARRRQSTDASPDDPAMAAQNQQTYDENLWQTVNTELRVSRVAFVDSGTALVTYRAYYGGTPSQVVRTPMTGVAERIDGQWRLSQAGMCELAQAANVQCASTGGPLASAFAAPPNGWNAVDSVPGVADAYRVLADPSSTVEQRLAVVDRGKELKAAIDAGVRADAPRAGQVSFTVSAARLLDATHAQILYSVIAEGDPRLETPFPFIGNATLVDGSWRVSSRFACGLTALATLKCPAAAALPTTTLPSTTTTRATTTTTVPPTTSATAPPPSLPDEPEDPATTVLVPVQP